MKKLKPWQWILLILVGLYVLDLVLPEEETSTSDSEKVETPPIQKTKEDSLQELTALKAKIEREINSLKDGVDYEPYLSELSSISRPLILYKAWAAMIKDHTGHPDQEVSSMIQELESLVKREQKANLPTIRATYAKLLGNQLWENDINVDISGKNKDVITFTGRSLSKNANKKKLHETVLPLLSEFRFKQDNYKWYKHDDEYTYWELKPASDEDLYE